MIQLPEVEVLRRELERDAVGRLTVKSVEVLSPATVLSPEESFGERLHRAKVTAVDRQGMLLFIFFANGEALGVSLGAGGQIRRQANRVERHKNTKVVIQFTKYGQLRLLDFKKGARMRLMSAEQARSEAPSGLDPLRAQISWTDFGNYVLGSKPQYLKDFLSRDSNVVGLGHLYSDEILFAAGLRYDRMSDSLGRPECRRLWRAIVEVMNDAVKYRGTTLEDGHFLSLEGSPGQYQDHLNVFRKHGQLSPRSRRPLVREKHRGRWTYFCEQSQV